MVTGIRRSLAFGAALVFVAGACGSDKRGATRDVGGDAVTSTTTAANPPSGRPQTTATTRRLGSGGSTHGTTSTSQNHAIRDAADDVPGRFAGVLLAPGPATAIVLDVLVQSGVSADPGTVEIIRQILAGTSAKPVTVRGPTPLKASSSVHDADEIRKLADDQGKPEQGDGTAVIHLLYFAGQFSDDSVLGATVRADTVGLFPDQMDQAVTPLVSRARIERAVVTHEIGHILGLVDIYLDDDRDDPAHRGHSTNSHSVMYWAVESDLVSQVLGGPPPVDFDGQDQADLRKIHSGAPRDT